MVDCVFGTRETERRLEDLVVGHMSEQNNRVDLATRAFEQRGSVCPQSGSQLRLHLPAGQGGFHG